jgi:hypothetical protein
MSPAAQSIIRRLDAARQKWWLFTLLSTAVMAFCVSLGTLLAFMLIDAFLKFPQMALAALFLVWLAVTIFLVVILCRRLTRSQRSLEATARRVEFEFPELGSNLINVVQLSEDSGNVDRHFCAAAVNQAASQIGHVNFEEAAGKESRWRRFKYCMQTPRDLGESFAVLAALIVAALVCHVLIPNMTSAASRLIQPWEFVPSVGSVKIVKVVPGDAEVLVGSTLDVEAEIENPEGKPYEARLFVTPRDEQETEMPMAPDDKHVRYTRTLPSILKPFSYRLEIGDSQTQVYTVGVREKPTVSEVEVTFHYPAYLGRPQETFIQKQADLEAPQYTVAELNIRPTVPIAGGHILSEGQQFTGRVEHNGQLLVVRMPLLKNSSYTIHLVNSAGHTDPSPRLNRIHVLPDNPPTIELLKPPRQGSSKSGDDEAVMIRSGDDHGLSRVRLEMKVKKTEAEAGEEPAEAVDAADNQLASTVQDWTDFDGKSTVVLHHRLALPADRFTPDRTVMVRAVAWDTRNFGEYGLDLKPQEIASGWHLIRIVDPDVEAMAELEQLDSLRGAIWKILEKQIRARVRAAMILKKEDAEEATQMAADVRTDQIEIQKAAIALVKSIGDEDREDRLTVKRILNELAFGEMLEAVQLCDDLAKVRSLEGFAEPVPPLNAKQDRIIEVLRGLMDVARQAQSDELAEMKKRPGGDLPPDVQEKLKEARDKLDEFLEQQKKVIEASENLAKKPVEDFSEEDEQLLKTLAATESDWSKFMNELNTDLSKLPEQDFANASMAKELNEVQTELKMAEDALLKKTADIAVPLEQLGAEMAEEIQTNLEKWLPDEPDRERWSQEESLSDAGKEAPMAELPGELEDLIGELLEEEEDIFDEMEDVSTSAADSLDKGAGWDAKDGPISNMSAKGVTGNTLPNTSEIGGRAGEGRSGKSSGEFVGDEAVGKGGRKTPSRLTPDPYMAGQIKDHSKDEQGGATGGGKESGEGGEGIEGPAPGPQPDREMSRLAGKQAALRNKAEGVDLQHFQITGYHHQDLQKMIELMAQIERDLKAGRYQNALRQRKVLAEGLAGVKQFLEGEFEVRKDETVNLPTDIQKEILGSMQDPSPTGWEELNRQYFERLATGGDSTNE